MITYMNIVSTCTITEQRISSYVKELNNGRYNTDNREKFSQQITENITQIQQSNLINNTFGERRESLLCLAILIDNLDLITLLLKIGADINADIPLHSALYSNKTEIASLLIDNGADVNAQDLNGYTALTLAVKLCNSKIVKKLLKSKEVKDINYGNPLHIALDRIRDCKIGKCDRKVDAEEIFQSLIQLKNIDIINTKNVCEETLLEAAMRFGNIEAMSLLVEKGLDINSSDKRKRAPLHLATIYGKTAASLLIDNGADVNAQDIDKKTPLHHAIDHQNIEIALLLIDNGADVNAQDIDKKTPLHHAIDHQNIEIALLLIDNGADVNAQDIDKKTALHYAIDHQNIEIALLLIEKGANFDSFDQPCKEYILLAAAKSNNAKVITSLISAGVDINSQDEYGKTLLHIAAECNNANLIATLTKQDANQKIEDGDGRIPIETFKENNNVGTINSIYTFSKYPKTKAAFSALCCTAVLMCAISEVALAIKQGFDMQKQLQKTLISVGTICCCALVLLYATLNKKSFAHNAKKDHQENDLQCPATAIHKADTNATGFMKEK